MAGSCFGKKLPVWQEHFMNDPSKDVKEKEQVRFDRLCTEFGM